MIAHPPPILNLIRASNFAGKQFQDDEAAVCKRLTTRSARCYVVFTVLDGKQYCRATLFVKGTKSGRIDANWQAPVAVRPVRDGGEAACAGE